MGTPKLKPSIPKNERSLLYTGSVKRLFDAGNGLMSVTHDDDTYSAFDVGRSEQALKGMWRALLRTSVDTYRLAEAVGIQTHFVGQEDEDTLLVRRFETPKDRPLRPDETDVMVRLEFIRRKYVSGRRAREYKAGTRKPTQDGFATDDHVPDGTILPCPTHEVTTKWEDEDLEIQDLQRILEYAGITAVEWERVWTLVDTLDGAIDLAAARAGFDHLDSKKEFALVGPGRHWMLIDSAGTQNEDRFAPRAKLQEGVVEHWSKEYLRQLLIAKGFKVQVDEARKRGGAELPKYPIFSELEVVEIMSRYNGFADRYRTAVNIILGSSEAGF